MTTADTLAEALRRIAGRCDTQAAYKIAREALAAYEAQAEAKPAPAEPVPAKVWEASNKTSSMLFASEACGKRWLSQFPASVGGGFELFERAVYRLAAAPAAPAQPVAFDAEGFRSWLKRELPDDTVIGNGTWWADHLTAWAQRFVKAAPAAPAERSALTPEWLWSQLMDWCKKRGSHPSEHNALFAIVSEARKLAAPAAPAQGVPAESAFVRELVRDWSSGVKGSNEVCIALASRLKSLAAPAAPAPLTLREQLDARTPWDELDAILTQNEKDAERYRWLAANALAMDAVADPDNFVRVWHGTDPAGCSYGKTLDEAIDAAIAASKGGGKP